VRGVPLGFTGAFTDVGTLDTHEVMWDFGDGTTIAFHSTTDPGALTPTHVYSTNGTYIVTTTIRDDDTGEDAVTSSVLVSAVGLIADPTNPGKSMLVIGGTAGNDDIRFARVNKTSNIDAFIGTQYLGRFNPTSRLVVFAGAGNDTVSMDKNISLSAILLGGDGDDVLTGGNGRDILIGGANADRINGGGDDDILIGGTTAHDANLIGLGRILNEWTSSGSLASRVNNLKTGGGLSAGFALNTSTVFNDSASDALTGGAGKDWFLFGTGDLLADLANTEPATLI
jgi:PKD repeat protein